MTSLAELPSYTLMQLPPDLSGEPPNEMSLKVDFEKGDTKTKILALKKVLYFILNGEKFPGLLMTIIRFVLPSQVVAFDPCFLSFQLTSSYSCCRTIPSKSCCSCFGRLCRRLTLKES
jgi:hypothetical protein